MEKFLGKPTQYWIELDKAVLEHGHNFDKILANAIMDAYKWRDRAGELRKDWDEVSAIADRNQRN